jgi:hypothetical protein
MTAKYRKITRSYNLKLNNFIPYRAFFVKYLFIGSYEKANVTSYKIIINKKKTGESYSPQNTTFALIYIIGRDKMYKVI